MTLSIADRKNTMALLNGILNNFSLDSADLYQQMSQSFGESISYEDVSAPTANINFDMALAFSLQLFIL
jgi:hypothetical protein